MSRLSTIKTPAPPASSVSPLPPNSESQNSPPFQNPDKPKNLIKMKALGLEPRLSP